MSKKGKLIIISGFSGSGKGTIVNRLLNSRDDIALSVSMTTRSPRKGEQDGISYFFVSREEFDKAVLNDDLLEYNIYGTGDGYGTPKKYVLDKLEAGNDVILEIDANGARTIKEKFPEVVMVFITTPSIQILKERLANRGTETADKIEKRMNQAKEEVHRIKEYDYLLINDDLDKCVADLEGIIQASHESNDKVTEFMPSEKSEFIDSLIKQFETL